MSEPPDSETQHCDPPGLPELIAAAQAGSPEAREELLATNLDMLRRFIRQRLGDKLRARETSQDLAQSVCRELLEDLDTFEDRGEGSFTGWLLARAENKIRKRAAFWGRAKRSVDREERSGLERLASLATPTWNLTSKERLDEVEGAIRALPDDYCEVVMLSRVEGLAHEEVALRMGRSVSAVQSLLLRALALLTANLK